RCALKLGDGRRVPLAGEGVRLGSVEAHRQVERPLRRGQPVNLVVRSRTLVLEVEVKRAVLVISERHPATHGKTIEAVCYLKAVTVVERDRPKGICWRYSAPVEVDCVFACTVERLTGFVAEVERVDRIFRQICTEANLRDDGTLEIIVAVHAH